MSIFETFSKRKKKLEKANKLDIYSYDNFPQSFCRQVIHIWSDALGPYRQSGYYDIHSSPNNNQAWHIIQKTLCRELGVFDLTNLGENVYEQCERYIQTTDTDGALDIIELSFQYIDTVIRKMPRYELEMRNITQDPDSAIHELNYRFREHGLGFEYINGHITRIDSQFIHENSIKPALSLLRNEKFLGPEEEFIKAHEHFRHGRQKEAIAEALKALESTLKSICDKKSWSYPPNVTSKGLIELIFRENLLPNELQSQFTSLRATLESGVPTVRNAKGGHGQGIHPVQIPDYLVAYCLNMTGTAIRFLVESFQNQK